MLGGFDAALARNRELFRSLAIRPRDSRLAIDLGAGCGFQSIPLAELGFKVTAIDLDRKLLEELRAHAGDLPIDTVRDDLLAFEQHAPKGAEVVVCMLDTVLHLPSSDDVLALITRVHGALAAGGRFILSFRDLTQEVAGLDRFIPVRSDDSTIFTCFLEYEPSTVKVHDLVYRKGSDGWSFHKSFYRKLRLAPQWVVEQLHAAGFTAVESSVTRGMYTVVAAR
jgi:hypothetical protein